MLTSPSAPKMLKIIKKSNDWIFIVVSSIYLTHVFLFHVNITRSEPVALLSHCDSVWYRSRNVWQDGAEKNLVIILAEGKRFLFVQSQLDESWDLTSHTHAGTQNIFKEVLCLSQLQNRLPGTHYIIPSGRSRPADICWSTETESSHCRHLCCFFFFFFFDHWMNDIRAAYCAAVCTVELILLHSADQSGHAPHYIARLY